MKVLGPASRIQSGRGVYVVSPLCLRGICAFIWTAGREVSLAPRDCGLDLPRGLPPYHPV